MTQPAPPPDEGGSASVLIAFARLEGKVDAALAIQSTKGDEHTRRLDDQEVRLRHLEATPTVTPRAMWSAVATIAAIVSALTPLLARLYS
ncbi:hypothetical protein [Krasilnikovia sp. MM14-A1259]|uniref:hypothetical protein n=1 Tax=Krasilnikovia sp. MM14-A1259 TaxID=3373539 RepID=UPI003807EB00